MVPNLMESNSQGIRQNHKSRCQDTANGGTQNPEQEVTAVSAVLIVLQFVQTNLV